MALLKTKISNHPNFADIERTLILRGFLVNDDHKEIEFFIPLSTTKTAKMCRNYSTPNFRGGQLPTPTKWFNETKKCNRLKTQNGQTNNPKKTAI